MYHNYHGSYVPIFFTAPNNKRSTFKRSIVRRERVSAVHRSDSGSPSVINRFEAVQQQCEPSYFWRSLGFRPNVVVDLVTLL